MPDQPQDWIALVEACYNLQGSNAEWLSRIVGQAAPFSQHGSAPPAWAFIGSCTSAQSFVVASDLTGDSGVVVATASDLVCPFVPDVQKAFMGLAAHGAGLLVMHCFDGAKGGVCIGVPLQQAAALSPVERRRWRQIAAHVATAFRLRNQLRELPHRPSGETVYATDDMRDKLRAVARRIGRPHAVAGRDAGGAAQAHWDGLVEGRWSLLDKFDVDGRRLVVAVGNAQHWPDPRGLTPRERQVAELVGLGKASKEIACMLGVTEAAVTNCTRRTQQKLGLGSRTELAAFFAPMGLRRELVEFAFAGDRLLVGSYPLCDDHAVAGLSAAERAIVAHVIAGHTNHAIAHRRGTSARTIANQLQSVYRKLRVRSRAELSAWLQAGRWRAAGDV